MERTPLDLRFRTVCETTFYLSVKTRLNSRVAEDLLHLTHLTSSMTVKYVVQAGQERLGFDGDGLAQAGLYQ
jgi:hypothetical protein